MIGVWKNLVNHWDQEAIEMHCLLTVNLKYIDNVVLFYKNHFIFFFLKEHFEKEPDGNYQHRMMYK